MNTTDITQHGEYVYYTRRPIDVGTIPTDADNMACKVICFDHRTPVNQDSFLAWGIVHYHKPLTEAQIEQYELRPSMSNPDVKRAMAMLAAGLGVWEEQNHIPEEARLTTRTFDDDPFSPKYGVTHKQLAEQYDFALRHPKPHIRKRGKAPPHKVKSR